MNVVTQEMYGFFNKELVESYRHDQDHSSGHKGHDHRFFGPWLVLWEGGQAPAGLQVSSTGKFVRRPSGERFNPKFTVKTVKHPARVMVWGCSSAAGREMLPFLDKTSP